MKVFGALSSTNPLLLAALGLHGLEDITQLYKANQQAHADDFLARAYMTGEPVTSLPGGPFRQIASKLTGGMVSPDVQATGTDLLQQQVLLNKMKGEKLKEFTTALNARKILGSEAGTAGGPFSQLLSGYNLPSELPSERHQRVTEEQAQQRIEQQSPEAKARLLAQTEAEKEALKLKYAPEEARIAAGKSAAEAEAKGAVELRLAPKLGYARGVGMAAAKRDVLAGTKLSEYPTTDFYDPTTLKNVTANSPDMTVAQARHSRMLPIKVGSADEKAVKSGISAVRELDEMNKLVDKVFPVAGNAASLKGKGQWNAIHRTSDPNLNAFYSHIDSLIGYVRSVQGRYPSTTEINLSSNFWPDPGTQHGIGLATSSDTRSNAKAKIAKLRTSILNGIRGGVVEGIPTEDAADVSSAIDGAKGE